MLLEKIKNFYLERKIPVTTHNWPDLNGGEHLRLSDLGNVGRSIAEEHGCPIDSRVTDVDIKWIIEK